jgi:uncharacterized membrane protein YkoI
MKRSRFFALAAIALLVVGAIGATGARTFAQTRTTVPAVQATSTPDSDDVQEGDQTGVDDESGKEEVQDAGDARDAAPTGTPAISAEAAWQAAEAHLNAGAATKVELDDENGKLVYSVEFNDGTDVKVDAETGEVLGVEAGQD